MATKTKNSVDLVRDAVLSLNKIEAGAAHTTRILAASCMVFYAENGGDKPARNRLAVMLDDVASEGVAKHILAWAGKNLAKYEPAIRVAVPEGAEAARDAVLAQFGDRAWSAVRSEHKPDKVEGGVAPPAKAVPADGPLKKIDPPVEVEAREVEVEYRGDVAGLATLLLTQIDKIGDEQLGALVARLSDELTARAEKVAEMAGPEAVAVNG